jgi:hypothetical protein
VAQSSLENTRCCGILTHATPTCCAGLHFCGDLPGAGVWPVETLWTSDSRHVSLSVRRPWASVATFESGRSQPERSFVTERPFYYIPPVHGRRERSGSFGGEAHPWGEAAEGTAAEARPLAPFAQHAWVWWYGASLHSATAEVAPLTDRRPARPHPRPRRYSQERPWVLLPNTPGRSGMQPLAARGGADRPGSDPPGPSRAVFGPKWPAVAPSEVRSGGHLRRRGFEVAGDYAVGGTLRLRTRLVVWSVRVALPGGVLGENQIPRRHPLGLSSHRLTTTVRAGSAADSSAACAAPARRWTVASGNTRTDATATGRHPRERRTTSGTTRAFMSSVRTVSCRSTSSVLISTLRTSCRAYAAAARDREPSPRTRGAESATSAPDEPARLPAPRHRRRLP